MALPLARRPPARGVLDADAIMTDRLTPAGDVLDVRGFQAVDSPASPRRRC
ncbi:MAG TPA: hypothetical protein VKV73_31765 [Chloroflexota bacterium]|nr:hypothetical protein [Chloroflexota bacterium]